MHDCLFLHFDCCCPKKVRSASSGSMSISQPKDRHGQWWIDLRINGRRIRRKAHVQSLEGAIEHEQRIKREFACAEELQDSIPLFSESTFAEFAERWMADYVSIANRRSTQREKECVLRTRLLPAFGHMRLNQISTNMIDAAVATWIRSGMSIKRANNILTILRKAFRCAVEWGLVANAPIIRHHRYFPPMPQYLTPAESQRLLDAMEPGFWKTLVLFQLCTGARFGEAAALQWADLDLDSNRPTVAIRRGVSNGIVSDPKTRASRRTVMLISELVTALKALRYRRPDSEWVFTSPSGRFYQPTNTVRVLKCACAKAGVPVISWHKLRHSCATQLLAHGVPLPAIKEVLGHTSLEVTSIYTHVVPGLMWEYMQTLSGTNGQRVSQLVSTIPALRTQPVCRSATSLH